MAEAKSAVDVADIALSEQDDSLSREEQKRLDRQLMAVGKDTVAKLAKSSVLIVGLSGTGVEIAKNVVLAGVGTMKVCDDTPLDGKERPADRSVSYLVNAATAVSSCGIS